LGKQRGGQGRSVSVDGDGGGSRRTTIIIAAVVFLFLGGFVALVILDSRERAVGGPPNGTEEIDVGGAGRHTEDDVNYDTSPPVGGVHNPTWQNAGFYSEPVRDENAVHTLEHGAVWIAYSPDLPQAQKDTIRELAEGRDCMLASPYPDLPSPVVATAWGFQIQLDGADDERLEQFIRQYRQGAQTPEPGAACTGGTSDTL
jgi:hypothetical protein